MLAERLKETLKVVSERSCSASTAEGELPTYGARPIKMHTLSCHQIQHYAINKPSAVSVLVSVLLKTVTGRPTAYLMVWSRYSSGLRPSG